ncbi:MAG: hypothetical protein ACREJO_10685 [Phycisphaerales bacterium]
MHEIIASRLRLRAWAATVTDFGGALVETGGCAAAAYRTRRSE